MKDLKGKVALITGGTSGIGLVVARQLVANGVRVVIAGRNEQQGQESAAALGDESQALFVKADVAQEKEIEMLVQKSLAQYGQIDLLFNNAGFEGTPGPIIETKADDIEKILATNVKGSLLLIKHVLPLLLERGEGTIVNTSSYIGTVMPFPVAMPYGAAKAAVLSITQAMAAGYAKDNIQTFAVCPWTTDTPMIDRLAGGNEDQKTQFAAVNPSGKLAKPEDIAQAVVNMFTGESGLPNGGAVLVDSDNKISIVHPLSYDGE